MRKRAGAFGLAVVAAVTAVTGIVTASAAGAAFHAESTPTWLKGTQETKNVLTVSGGTFKCSVGEFKSGEIVGTSVSSVTVHPTYSSCTGFGLPVEVSTTGCDYKLTASSATVGAVQIVCETGKEIVLTIPSGGPCTINIPGQTPGTPTLKYTSSGSGASRTVRVTSEVGGIIYTSSGGSCGASGTAGTYTGSMLTKGYSDSGFVTQHGIWVE